MRSFGVPVRRFLAGRCESSLSSDCDLARLDAVLLEPADVMDPDGDGERHGLSVLKRANRGDRGGVLVPTDERGLEHSIVAL